MSGYNFKYHDTRPKTCPQPVGFYHYKAKQCYKTTVAPPQNGTHVKLHENLTERWRRPDTGGNKLAYGPAFRILYSQRQRQKIYTGQAPPNMYTANSTTRKLASYDPLRQPAESTLFRDMLYYPHSVCNKPLYSKEEVQSIVDRLHNRKKREGREPALLMLDKTRKSYPAEMVAELVDMYGSTNRLCPKPPYRNLFRDRTKAHDVVASSKKLTNEQVDTMVNRLQEFDIQKWPPNSTHVKTQDPASPVPRKYPPPDSATTRRSIECTTDRLYNNRWKSDDSDGKKSDDEEYESDADVDNEQHHQKDED